MEIIWDLSDDLKGNVQHIAEHGITLEEVEEVLLNRRNPHTVSRTSGNRLVFGYTSTGRYLAVVWEKVLDDPLTIYRPSAYDAPEPRKRK
jgi:uncharacterized DUF497 family protein